MERLLSQREDVLSQKEGATRRYRPNSFDLFEPVQGHLSSPLTWAPDFTQEALSDELTQT
jgi:hypothetical protein